MAEFLKFNIKLIIIFFSMSTLSQSPCEIRDRNALIELFNDTDGPNWTVNTNWNTNEPLNTWYGITTNNNGCVIEIDFGAANNLTGTIPLEIGNLTNLELLDLRSQNLNGIIPVTIGDLKSLIWLDLGENKLSGILPNSLGNLIELEFLSIRMNQFTGQLPDTLGNLVGLNYLTADQNYFTGNLPDSLSNLKELEALWLFENQLTGPIPNSFSEFTSLSQLLLSDNLLNNEIPNFWESLSDLEVLWLGSNLFEGEIPSSLSLLHNLEQLHLQDNKLIGSIPSDFSNLTSLQSLWLGDNEFTGNIPAELGTIVTLQTLAIYRTNISGEIPEELGNLHNLTQLWLPLNKLIGVIPESLTNLVNLTELFLSDNKLTGEIPPNLNQLNFLTSLNVENNLLSGSIPDFSNSPLDYLYFKNNQFQFGDFEDQFNYYFSNLTLLSDNPQAKLDEIERITGNIGSNFLITTNASGDENHYQWYKDGVLIEDAPDTPTLVLANLQSEDAGVYHATVISDIVTDLILVRNEVTLVTVCESLVVEGKEDITVCEIYVLPNLSVDNYYFTEEGGEGLQLKGGDIISSSQRVYIFTGSQECWSESSFEINIKTIDPLRKQDDVFACENYKLPTLEYGNYFTESNGGGEALYSGDIIVTAQRIFIFKENDACTDEQSFEILFDVNECVKPEMEIAITFPEFFTPNGDGVNDEWGLNLKGGNIDGYVFIYDRYGKLLNQIRAATDVWDGTYNGMRMPSSDYWYNYISSETDISTRGHFTLKR